MNTQTYPTYVALDVMIHVSILLIFLSAFFFLYVSKIETNVFQQEIGNNLETSVTDILNKNREQVLPRINQIRPALVQWQKLYSAPTSFSTEKNKMIKFTAVFIIILLLCMIGSIVLTLKFDCGKTTDIGHIFFENVAVFICIGIVEFWFFTNVAMKYIPTSPSLMVNTMLNTVKAELSTS